MLSASIRKIADSAFFHNSRLSGFVSLKCAVRHDIIHESRRAVGYENCYMR